mmetsp:Transcript_12837/g.25889  ORF Transcript_12837/g.25889 Transcript_12837/m.25889 type:complete len:213 (+) Transcript_12837:1675-2313(+)
MLQSVGVVFVMVNHPFDTINLYASLIVIRLAVHANRHLVDTLLCTVRRCEDPATSDERSTAEWKARCSLERDEELVLPRIVKFLAPDNTSPNERKGWLGCRGHAVSGNIRAGGNRATAPSSSIGGDTTSKLAGWRARRMRREGLGGGAWWRWGGRGGTGRGGRGAGAIAAILAISAELAERILRSLTAVVASGIACILACICAKRDVSTKWR